MQPALDYPEFIASSVDLLFKNWKALQIFFTYCFEMYDQQKSFFLVLASIEEF